MQDFSSILILFIIISFQINFIATNESRRESNLTDSLLKNLKLLLNLSQQNNRIDLIWLRSMLCFHHEILCLIFFAIFFFQILFNNFGRLFSNICRDRFSRKIKSQSKSSLNNVVVVDGDGDGDGDGVNGVDCGHQHLMRTTITFQMKKIISFGLILAYLIEWTTMMMMMMILYETLILNKIIQFCCSILLSFIVTVNLLMNISFDCLN